MHLTNSSASSDPSLAALLLAAGAPGSAAPAPTAATESDASAPGFEQLFSDVAGESQGEEAEPAEAADLWGSSNIGAEPVVCAADILATADTALATVAYTYAASTAQTETPVAAESDDADVSEAVETTSPDARTAAPTRAAAAVISPCAEPASAPVSSPAAVAATTPPSIPAERSTPAVETPVASNGAEDRQAVPSPVVVENPVAPEGHTPTTAAYEPWREAGTTVPAAQALLYRRSYPVSEGTSADVSAPPATWSAPMAESATPEAEEPMSPVVLFSSQHASMRQAGVVAAPSATTRSVPEVAPAVPPAALPLETGGELDMPGDVQAAFGRAIASAEQETLPAATTPAAQRAAAESAAPMTMPREGERPGAGQRPASRNASGGVATPREAIFADSTGVKRETAAPVESSLFKRFVSTEDQQVTVHDQAVGIGVAKSAPIMPAQPASTPAHPLSEYTGVLGVAETNLGEVAETASAEPLPELASAHEAVEVVLHAIEQVAQRGQKSVNLQFSVGDQDLSVRVELQGGEVRTTFRTDSDELRAALSQEWQVVSAQAGDRPAKIATPVFTTSSQSGSDSAAGDASSRQRENHGQAQREGTHQAPAFASLAPRSNAVPAAARPEVRPVYANSRHLQTLA